MKVCVIYDTKKGSTEMIANWMRESIERKAEVRMMHVTKVDSLKDCDLVVIGSPIYYERPLKSVLKFLEQRQNELKGKKVAVFVVCMAGIFGHAGKTYAEKRYVGALIKRVPGKIIGTAIIRGWIRKPDFSQKVVVQKWIKELLKNLEVKS
ncbi:MAG: flavodoxin domain-containing protein [Thermococcus sp.]|uniref:flavodoxin domain-containing protein n=1 Tax=Thermococcus sp. TaxID=35749 RepID=UPI001DAA89D6|nr:flavodoxin domain-containing protein [Thermococcus sp.]MBO8174304.1 flavodoxin domain-containing protein [Thermococcus sp.]